jgi:hypothetical protein
MGWKNWLMEHQKKFIDDFDIDFEQLWEDGGYAKDNPLENSLRYVRKEAQDRGISDEAIEMGILDVFSQMARGKTFSTEKCGCGCGINKSGTDATHYMLKRVMEIDVEVNKLYAQVVGKRMNNAIKAHIWGKKLGTNRRLWFELVRSR